MYIQGGHSGDGSGDHLPQDYLRSSPEDLPEDREELGMGVTTAQLEQDSRPRTELKQDSLFMGGADLGNQDFTKYTGEALTSCNRPFQSWNVPLTGHHKQA